MDQLFIQYASQSAPLSDAEFAAGAASFPVSQQASAVAMLARKQAKESAKTAKAGQQATREKQLGITGEAGAPGGLAKLGVAATTPQRKKEFGQGVLPVLQQLQGGERAGALHRLGAQMSIARGEQREQLRKEAVRTTSVMPLEREVRELKARLLLDIASGVDIGPEKQKFLDTLANMDPLVAWRRTILGDVGLPQETPSNRKNRLMNEIKGDPNAKDYKIVKPDMSNDEEKRFAENGYLIIKDKKTGARAAYTGMIGNQ